MSFTDREFWTVIHGMGFGAVFLLAFAGGLAGLCSFRPEFATPASMATIESRRCRPAWIASRCNGHSRSNPQKRRTVSRMRLPC